MSEEEWETRMEKEKWNDNTSKYVNRILLSEEESDYFEHVWYIVDDMDEDYQAMFYRIYVDDYEQWKKLPSDYHGCIRTLRIHRMCTNAKKIHLVQVLHSISEDEAVVLRWIEIEEKLESPHKKHTRKTLEKIYEKIYRLLS